MVFSLLLRSLLVYMRIIAAGSVSCRPSDFNFGQNWKPGSGTSTGEIPILEGSVRGFDHGQGTDKRLSDLGELSNFTTIFSNVRNSDEELRFLLFGHNSLPNQINKKMIELVADFISNVKNLPLIIPH
jgi:hypothetical protein